MSVMGIDPSLTSTGIVMLSANEEFESSAIQATTRGVERLAEIREAIWDAADTWFELPRLVAIESYAFGARGAAMFSLGELGGVLRWSLYSWHVPYIDVPPSQVKKFATGHGNAKKDEIMLAVYKRWGVEFHTSDEADAYVLARIALALTEGDDKLTEFQREVVKALKSKEPERFKEMVEWTERGSSSR